MTALADASEPKEGPFRRLVLAVRDRLAASDPAFSRLRLAARAMLAMALSAIALAIPTLALEPLPIAAYGVAVPLSFMGTLAVRDATAAGQIITRLLGVAVAVASVALASLLSPITWLTDAVYLVVIFVAVYVRKFGPRGFMLGMVAFICFFMGDYLRPAPAGLVWVAYSAVATLAATHIVTNFLLPSDPERDFRRALVSIDQRIGLLLHEVRELSTDPQADEASKTLRKRMGRLRTTILMAEGFLPQGEEGSLAAEGAASEVAIALFDVQLLLERTARARHLGPLPDRLIRAVLARDAAIVEKEAAVLRGLGPDKEVPSRLLIRLYRARKRLDDALGSRPSPAFATRGTPPAAGSDGPESSTSSLIPSTLHVPVQVTLACAIAMASGLLISQQRWYWAVITAFIVFNNTRSRGDTAMRALQRSGGTLGGILAGGLVAAALHGQMGLSIALIVVSVFFAFYYLQVSYGLLIFFVTIALAIGYGMAGMFAPGILLVRLEETVVGAIAGTAMAFLVFPKSTSAGAAEALDAYLDALATLAQSAASKAHGASDTGDVLGQSRELDRRYADLVTAARPLGGPWNAVSRFGQVRERLLLLTGATHWARSLARALSEGGDISDDQLARIDTLSKGIGEQIAAARQQETSFFLTEKRDGAAVGGTPHPAAVSPMSDHPVVALEQISVLLDRLVAETGGKS